MFDSPDQRPPTGGQFSLPQLARAAVYHAEGHRAEATLAVMATGLPAGAGHGVAAGAWWATQQARGPLGDRDPAFVSWVSTRAATLGADPASTRALLEAPLAATVDAPVAGTSLPMRVPLLQVTGSLPSLIARLDLFRSAVALGFSAATHARALCDAADGRPVIDAAAVHHPDPITSPFLAWCGRVGGMSGTTHTRAGWRWEVPVVGAPSRHAPALESQDAVIDTDDLHASVASLAQQVTSWSSPPGRIRLDRPLIDDVDLERHFLLRRALDRHGLRRARICAEVLPTVPAVQRVVRSAVPVDILLFGTPWWSTAVQVRAVLHMPAEVPPFLAPAPDDWVGRAQLRRHDDSVYQVPWSTEGILRPLFSTDRPLTATPAALPRRDALRAPVSPDPGPAPVEAGAGEASSASGVGQRQ